MPRSRALLVVVILAAAASLASAQARRDADRLQQKIDQIAEHGLSRRKAVLRTSISETEVNSYLAVYGKGQLPAGVVEPRLTILGEDRVSGRAVIDLDEVRRNGSGGWLDPASYLTGRVPVFAQGVLRTKDGVARFRLDSAQVAGITVPKSILQEIVGHYTRTPDMPNGVSLDEPFPLPAGIRQIEMRRGEATVVQ